MTDVLILRQEDGQARQWARRLKLQLLVTDSWELRGDRCLFASSARVIPWHMVGAGYRFLNAWDAAAPLWRYNVLAGDIGEPGERARTEKIIRDLRVPLYAPELLFVANTETGRELVRVWREEARGDADERLAFLRAMHLVKPRLCTLPTIWLSEVALSDGSARVKAKPGAPQNLVSVEILPGRYVRCKPGEEAAVKARFDRMLQGRNGEKAVTRPPRHKMRTVETIANKGEER